MRRLLTALILSLATPALAEEALVYWPLVSDGTEYRRVAYPEEAGDLVVMAGTPVVIEARQAEVRFWPITREYLAAVTSRSPTVGDALELVAADGAVTRVEAKPYVLWHPEGVGAGPAELVTGSRAADVHEAFVAESRAASAAIQKHQRIVAEHHAAVEAWLKLAAQRPANLPPPPPEFTRPEPAPYHAFATAPDVAPVTELAPGQYTVRLVDAAGQEVSGSARRLTAIAPRAEGVGYVLRPGDRWTQPLVSFDPEETIYTTGRSDLYIQPVRVAAYGARDYSRLFRPQTHEAADPYLSLWVPAAGAAGMAEGRLGIWDGSDRVATLEMQDFRVAQQSGAGYGYLIEPFVPRPGEPLTPDFQAMRLPVELPHSRIAMVGADGAESGDRALRLVEPPPAGLMFLPALLPVMLGMALRFRRRRPRRAGQPIAAA